MKAYLNGQFMPVSEAKISPLDRGFLYSDGVYEVIPAYSRALFGYEGHMARLKRSLDGIRLKNPLTDEKWRELILKLVAESSFEDQAVYLQVTRGTDKKRDPAFPQADVEPSVFLFTAKLPLPSAENREKGAAAITLQDIRWGRCDLKSVSLLPNVMARQQAADAGCVEAVMLRDGFLTEGSASNAFVVKDGLILTPPANQKILSGITRSMVLELAGKHRLSCEERPISETELREADELWISSSTKEVLSITRLDGEPVGNGAQAGKVGNVYKKLYAAFCEYRDACCMKEKHA